MFLIPQQEIWELQRTGLKQLFTLDSVFYDEDFDLSDLLGGIMVAALQVIVGACVAAMGHPYLATFFIEEGIGDLIYAAQSAIDGGEFNWKHYRVNKITSCAFHIVTMGIEVMKERLSTKAASKITHTAVNKATQSTLINKISQESMREMIKEKIVTTLISSGAKATINLPFRTLERTFPN